MSAPPKRNKYDYLFNIDFRKYYEIILQQRGFVFVFVISAMLSALFFSYFFSEKYEAGIQVYYRPIETSLMRFKETQAFGSPVPASSFKIIVQTLRDLSKSEAILVPVIEELHLDQPITPTYETWYKRYFYKAKHFIKETGSKLWTILKYGRLMEEDPTAKALEELRENIRVVETKESYVYILAVKDKFPDRAAAIVDALGGEIVKWLKQQGTGLASERISQLRDQLAAKEREIDTLRTKKERILKDGGIVSITEEYSSGVQSLYELETEKVRLEAEIENYRARLAAYKEQLTKGRGIKPEDFRNLESKAIFDKVSLKGLRSRLDSLRSSISGLQQKLTATLEAEKVVENINMKLNAEMREYIHLKDMYVENNAQLINSASEIKIMHPALIPTKPVQPIKIYYVGLSGLLALFVASGLVYVLAFFNIRMFFASRGVQARKQQ